MSHHADDQPSGEIHVEASSNGRQITLDPIVEHDIVAHARQVESSLPCGFRVGWIDGKDDHVAEGQSLKFDLSCGAGVGGRYLILSVDIDGKHIDEIIDISDLVTDWVNAVAARQRA